MVSIWEQQWQYDAFLFIVFGCIVICGRTKSFFMFPSRSSNLAGGLPLVDRKSADGKCSMSMHDEILCTRKLRLPIPSDHDISRGEPPLDIESIHAELEKIGEYRERIDDIWYTLPKHEKYIVDHVFKLGDDNGGAVQGYKLPWLDPGKCRWEETSPEGELLGLMKLAVEGLAKSHPLKYKAFEDAALEECDRIKDTRNCVAARTLAFLVCLLMEGNPNKEDMYLNLEKRGIIEATLLAPHWRAISATVHLPSPPSFAINSRAIQRVIAYFTMACKRPNAASRWSIISHYLAGLGGGCWDWDDRSEDTVEMKTLKIVKGIAQENLEAIGQELAAFYSLLELDDPSLSELRSISEDLTIERQDDDAVMGLDTRYFLRSKSQDEDDIESFFVNTTALTELHSSIDQFDTSHYVHKASVQVIPPRQWKTVTKQWPELSSTKIVGQVMAETVRLVQPKVLCRDLYADLLYAFMLVNYAREKINTSFQNAMWAMFPKNYTPGEVKSIGRTFFKARDDYREKKQPRAACVRDIVRCTLVFKKCSEMVEAYQKIKLLCQVTGVKNLFAREKTNYSYRQILVNILHEAPGGEKMICEIQMQLESYLRVREQLRVYYDIFRCKTWKSMKDLVGPESHTYWHLGEI